MLDRQLSPFQGYCYELQKHDSASKQDKVQVWEEQRPVSKYAAGLHQEPSTGRTIPSDPSQWACAETGVKENLWLNLSTGTIGSGRQVIVQTQDPTYVSMLCTFGSH